MDHARAGRGRRLRDARRAFGLHRLEALLAALEQDADEVDHHIRAAHRGLDRGRIAQVRLHGMDLPDAPHRLQVEREIGPAHRGADAIALARERAHHMAAEEARAAEHRDQRFGGNFGHGKRLWARAEGDRLSRREMPPPQALTRRNARPYVCRA